MNRPRPKLDQLNIVSGDVGASLEFYRRLGVDVPERNVWRTATGAHHASAGRATENNTAELEIDSVAFARIWNTGWHGRNDIRGRVVVGFQLPTRAAVDELYAEMTAAGYPGLQPPYDALWGARYAVLEDPDGVAVGLMSPISPDKRSPPPDV